MLVCKAKGFLVVRTEFDDKFFLIQKFRGLDNSFLYNSPIDIMESGLMFKKKYDYWHIDVPFSINTDEAVPASINGEFIGGNHGCSCAIEVYAPNHGKSFSDIGLVWIDEDDVSFTLLRIIDDDYLLFVSENKGNSIENYSFVKKVCGKLTFAKKGTIGNSIYPKEQKLVEIRPVIRYKKKEVLAYINGVERKFHGEIDCDYVELHEEYEIINPATIAPQLRKFRPKDGFKNQPNLACFGDGMLSCCLTYRIDNDGTIYTIFDYKKLSNIKFENFMGVMYQEKLDVYGGGIWRYFPKILPFKTSEGEFDFSSSLNILTDIFPKDLMLTREYFSDEKSPCERVVDYFKDVDGKERLAFACGFLPIYDGCPEIRSNQINNIIHLKSTRKFYPFFAEGDLTQVKGVAYKKYFIPTQDNGSYYIIKFNDKYYIYVDILKDKTIEIPFVGKIQLMEKSSDITYEIKGCRLYVKGKKGFATFISNSF